MNIEFLEQIFNDQETDYYIVKYWENIFFIGVPTLIRNARTLHCEDHKFKDQTWQTITKLLKTPIDCNIDVKGDLAPFQLGMTIEYVENFYKVDGNIVSEFLEAAKLEKNKTLDFWGCTTLIRTLEKEKEVKPENQESQTLPI